MRHNLNIHPPSDFSQTRPPQIYVYVYICMMCKICVSQGDFKVKKVV